MISLTYPATIQSDIRRTVTRRRAAAPATRREGGVLEPVRLLPLGGPRNNRRKRGEAAASDAVPGVLLRGAGIVAVAVAARAVRVAEEPLSAGRRRAAQIDES